MRKMIRLAACLLVVECTALQAQDTTQSFDGYWRFTIQPPDLQFANTGEVTLSGTSGTWKIFARKNKQMFNIPCIGRPFPLAILSSEPGASLVFQVHESDTIQGCSNVKVSLRVVTANRLEGFTATGTPVVMERDEAPAQP